MTFPNGKRNAHKVSPTLTPIDFRARKGIIKMSRTGSPVAHCRYRAAAAAVLSRLEPPPTTTRLFPIAVSRGLCGHYPKIGRCDAFVPFSKERFSVRNEFPIISDDILALSLAYNIIH